MKAKVYDPAKCLVGGYYMSEKLDGCRAFWDGGVTRGVKTSCVPWAGILNPKTGQPKTKVKPWATGLWSQYGNPVMAPEWFLNQLPCVPLEGELWCGRGNFQQVTKTIRKDVPDDTQWKGVQYAIFGTPDWEAFIADGEIKNANQLTDIRNAARFLKSLPDKLVSEWKCLPPGMSFSTELAHLNDWINNYNGVTFLVKQTKLPEDNFEAAQIVEEKREQLILEGGEGLFLRAPDSVWVPKRVKTCLKYKGELDDEGTVVGFTSGRKTDKGSKLLGMIGALILDYRGKRLELSGLTNEEREFETKYQKIYATGNPGQDMPGEFQGKMFKTGDLVTFTYRELTDEGVPKEARYYRKRN
jgi:DNA ligase-1